MHFYVLDDYGMEKGQREEKKVLEYKTRGFFDIAAFKCLNVIKISTDVKVNSDSNIQHINLI